jgi:hypothetical protein
LWNTWECTIPPGDGTTTTVVAEIAGGQVSPVPVAFNWQPPVITAIKPLTGSTLGGASMTLTGYNFGLGEAGTFGLTWQGSAVAGAVLNETHCIFTLPQGFGSDILPVLTVGGLSSSVRSASALVTFIWFFFVLLFW